MYLTSKNKYFPVQSLSLMVMVKLFSCLSLDPVGFFILLSLFPCREGAYIKAGLAVKSAEVNPLYALLSKMSAV